MALHSPSLVDCCCDRHQSNYEYGFSFALATAAWPLSWLTLLLASIPWPYHPAAYDRTRYGQPPAAAAPFQEGEEAQAAERQRALQAGGLAGRAAGGRPGLSERLWSAFGVSPEQRKGYAEKWGGPSGGGYGEAQERRETGRRREESLEEGRRLRGSEREGRGEGQAMRGPLSGSSGSGGAGGLSGTTGGPLRPAISSTAGSEQRAEDVPVVKMHI